MTYTISYDLNKPGKDYQDLYKKIKSLGSTWCHPLDSTWYLVSEYSAAQIRDALLSVMDNSDELLVTTASAPGSWHGLSNEVSQWLRNNL